MLKSLKNLFFSIKSAVIMMFLFAFSIGLATFIENDFGTETAKAEVYNALWFEILMILLAINLVYNIYRFKLYRKDKWLIGLFHAAFIVILIGAAVTRYISYEGIMHIREGETSNTIISDRTYIQIDIEKEGRRYHYEFPIILSRLSKNSFEKSLKANSDEIEIKLKKFIPNAVSRLVESKEGEPYISLVVSSGDSPVNINLKKGEYFDAGSVIISFESKTQSDKPVILIENKNGKLFIKTPVDIQTVSMGDQKEELIKAGEKKEFEKRKLYRAGKVNFVLQKYLPHAKTALISASEKKGKRKLSDALVFEIKDKEEKKEITVFGSKSSVGVPVTVTIGGKKVTVAYGSKIIKLPFSLRLIDFEIKKYPGSMSPSSYASEVMLIDEERGIREPFRIYMNHVLDYRGYRFFQSSYDMDERGTVLSVNHDPGTLITYIGYLMLGIGMVFHLFLPGSRFMKLIRLTKKLQSKRSLMASLLLPLFLLFSQNAEANETLSADEILKTAKAFSKEHAEKFGELLVQDVNGRIKPIDTLSRDVIHKVSRRESILGLEPNQIFLGMVVKPRVWQEIKMIYVSHPKLKEIIGMKPDEKYASFNMFFEYTNGPKYIIAKYVQQAVQKKPSQRDKFDKDLIKVDERVNICYMSYTGELLKIFPKPNDKNQKWYSPLEAIKTFPPKEAELVRLMMASYFSNIDEALKNGDWDKADKSLNVIKEYQKFYGASIIPSESRIKAELLYNKLDIFNRLVPYFIIIGFILLVITLANLINPRINIGPAVKIAFVLLMAGFLILTFGMGLRWYVSGHAPWSNGYESMVYIAWATILAGFFFVKNSSVTLAATSLLGGLILFVAHLNWLDPQITNLVPVLKSYWLMIHVSVITASYGFLGLSALLAFIVLLLYIFMTEKNRESLILTIKELSYTNEMSLILGLILVTLGNFLGGVWANESWGRYWGWDPKETWALVVILTYAGVEHLRLIPRLNGIFLYNVASLLAFSTVIMTYFGVNFYLSGLHSYASGDPVPVPTWVYFAVATVFFIVMAAYYKKQKLGIDMRM
ncbi:cytochrome c biogenesis protein [Nitrosophilus alvini]|uniref:cytochrome c biogenesis protein n=1 Tax=Nitrosophilus alvini TaxID=2714855 RepID=UPI00190C45EC|nr:cytochrome c biogenesis protein CcsA [Nitrosophilus alvini]